MKSLKSKLLTGILLVIIFLFSFFPQTLFSQQNDIMLNFFWDFYSQNYLSTQAGGKGYTGIAGENDISGALLNPASINIKNKYSVLASYTYKSDLPWLKAVTPDFYVKPYHPALFAGVGFKPHKNITLALLYNNGNSHRFKDQTVRTDEFGNYLGTYDWIDEASINTVSLPAVYYFNDKIKIGLALNYSFFHRRVSSFTTEINPDYGEEAKADFQKFYPSIGIVISPVTPLSAGITFKPELEEYVKMETDGEEPYVYGKANIFPAHVGAGLSYKFMNIPLRLYLDYNYYNSSASYNLNDRNDIHFGAEYDAKKDITVRAGFIYLKDYRNNDVNWIDPVGKYDQYFLTSGASVKLKNFMFNASLMDSHLSTGLIKQTIVNAGLSWDY